MASVGPINAVVFDYGGVLTTPVRDSIAAWVEADGIEPDSFSGALKAWLSAGAAPGTPVHRLETGELSIADFEVLLAAELVTTSGTPVRANGLLGRLFASMHPDAAMYQLAAELRACGVQVAVLSNSWGNTYPRARLEAAFAPVVVSGEVGLRKPLAPIYELTLTTMDVPAAQALFIDDASANVLGARAVGMHALLHQNAATTRAAIAAFVPQLAARSRS